jgi:hypothetical protein
MSFEKFINEHKEDINYLKSKRILYQEEVDKLIVDNKAISGITVDALEVTLLGRLLDNLCPDLLLLYLYVHKLCHVICLISA